MEDYGINAHKLMYHVSRVQEWLDKGDTFPIYIEISPIGKCNHRCVFCSFDYLGYENPILDKGVLIERIREMKSLGLRAIMYAGEGEPLLHPRINEIVRFANSIGIDVSITTNGVLLHKFIEESLKYLTWIRISLDAGSKDTYAKIHNCKPEDYSLVISNLEEMVEQKKANNLGCTIGTQLILLRTNYQEVVSLASVLRDIGVDYFSVKPYSQHPSSASKVDSDFTYEELENLNKALRIVETQEFKVVFRSSALGRVGKEKEYEQCLGLPFFAYIDSKGDVNTCSTFLGDADFCYGNIYESTFDDIWRGSKRKRVLEMAYNMDVSICRENCRLDPINEYLWGLKHPSSHINFI